MCKIIFFLAVFACLPFLRSESAAGDFPAAFPEEWKTKTFRERSARELAPGVTYYRYHFDNLEGQPLSVYYVVVEWDKANVELKLSQATNAVKTVREQVAHMHPVAAINGAYFKWKTEATGKIDTYYPLKIAGELFMPPDRYDNASAIVFDVGEFPKIVKQDEIASYDNAIMGYHVWKDGKFMLGGERQPRTLSGRTPLTAFGINPETRLVAFMVADGRFEHEAPGINFYGVGYLLQAVGCTDAVSLDGGGSCTMLIRTADRELELVNRPSDNRTFDHKGVRRVQNCIYLIEKSTNRTD